MEGEQEEVIMDPVGLMEQFQYFRPLAQLEVEEGESKMELPLKLADLVAEAVTTLMPEH